MLYDKEGQLLRRSKGEDANMKKINILLCDDDKDFLRRLADTVTKQPLPRANLSTVLPSQRNGHTRRPDSTVPHDAGRPVWPGCCTV